MKPSTRLLSLAALIGLSLTNLTDHRAGHAAACATITILRVTGWAEPAPETELLRNGIDQFNRLNPCILARYSPTTQPDYQQEIGREIARKTEPDVFYASPDMIATEGQIGRLLTLDPYLAHDRVSLGSYIPALLREFQFNGSTYGLPKDWGTLGLYYNMDIFDAEHVPYPTSHLTYPQFRALAKRLTTSGTMMPSDFINLLPFLYGFGTGIVDPTMGGVLFDNPRAIQALTYYTDFQLVDHSAITPEAAGSSDIDSLGKGQTAMVIDGSWQLPYLRSAYPNLRFGVAELPIGPAGRAAPVFTNAWSASARTANPAAAVKLIEYLTGTTFQAQQLHIGFALPTLTALQADSYLKTHPDVYSFFSEYTTGKPANFGRYESAVNQVLSDAVTAVLARKHTPAQAIATAAGRLRQLVTVQSR